MNPGELASLGADLLAAITEEETAFANAGGSQIVPVYSTPGYTADEL